MKYTKGNVEVIREKGKIEIVCKKCGKAILSRTMKSFDNKRPGLFAKCQHYKVYVIGKIPEQLQAYYDESRSAEAIYIEKFLVFIIVPRKQ